MSSLIDEVREIKALPTPSVARMIRLSAGVSQSRLAKELGVHRMTVARWEAGTRNPRGAARSQYAEILRLLRSEIAS